MRIPRLICITVLCLSGIAISHANDTDSSIDAKLKQLIHAHKLSGDAARLIDKKVDINSPLAQLGMTLFYSKSLGGEQDTACVSCHHPVLGGGDGLSLPIGTGATDPAMIGPGRTLKRGDYVTVPRNAPTTFNIALWQKHLFHDGRIKRLGPYAIRTPDVAYEKADALSGDTLVQAQARFPTTSREEMRGSFMQSAYNQTMRRSLISRLQLRWEQAFRQGFNDKRTPVTDLITEQNAAEAIAAYESSQLFVNNPWKRYVQGEQFAISPLAKQGALLFFNKHDDGGADCVSCHSGDFFTDEEFYVTGIPQIGEGKPKDKSDTSHDDSGCYLVSGKKDDLYHFRTPSLLNVEVTGPWGHNGAYTSLEAVTRHMLQPEKSLRNYQAKQLRQSGIRTENQANNAQRLLKHPLDLKPRASSDQDVMALVEFMKTLTDPCVKSRDCLSPWIPKPGSNDPDGNMLHGLGRNGQRL